jgi:hypothetical protein
VVAELAPIGTELVDRYAPARAPHGVDGARQVGGLLLPLPLTDADTSRT